MLSANTILIRPASISGHTRSIWVRSCMAWQNEGTSISQPQVSKVYGYEGRADTVGKCLQRLWRLKLMFVARAAFDAMPEVA